MSRVARALARMIDHLATFVEGYWMAMAMAIALTRLAGVTHPAFQAAAHLFVGGLAVALVASLHRQSSSPPELRPDDGGDWPTLTPFPWPLMAAFVTLNAVEIVCAAVKILSR